VRTQRSIARWTGAVYLVVVLTGMFSLAYVPGQLRAVGDPAGMLDHIVARQRLFQAGIASFVLEQLAFLALPFLLHRLLREGQRTLAAAMVVLAVIAVPIALVAAAHRLDALAVLTDPGFDAVSSNLREAMALQSMMAYRHAIFLTTLFWGLWLLPLGVLVYRSRRLPRVLGAALVLGGLGYVCNVFGELLLPGYDQSAVSNYATLPAAFGEIGLCLWLLLFGMRATASPRETTE
jgi:hypothetical protein